MQFCFRLLFRFHRDFFQWFGRPSPVNTVYTKQEIYTQTCLLLHKYNCKNNVFKHSTYLSLVRQTHSRGQYHTESVLPVSNLILRVKMGLCGWTKFGLVWEQFGKVACTVLHLISHHVVTKHTHTAAGIG